MLRSGMANSHAYVSELIAFWLQTGNKDRHPFPYAAHSLFVQKSRIWQCYAKKTENMHPYEGAIEPKFILCQFS